MAGSTSGPWGEEGEDPDALRRHGLRRLPAARSRGGAVGGQPKAGALDANLESGPAHRGAGVADVLAQPHRPSCPMVSRGTPHAHAEATARPEV